MIKSASPMFETLGCIALYTLLSSNKLINAHSDMNTHMTFSSPLVDSLAGYAWIIIPLNSLILLAFLSTIILSISHHLPSKSVKPWPNIDTNLSMNLLATSCLLPATIITLWPSYLPLKQLYAITLNAVSVAPILRDLFSISL